VVSQRPEPPALPREGPGTRYRRLNGPQGRSGRACPPPGFDPRTVQPVASRYAVTLTRPIRVGTWSFILAGMWSEREANHYYFVLNLGLSGYILSPLPPNVFMARKKRDNFTIYRKFVTVFT